MKSSKRLWVQLHFCIVPKSISKSSNLLWQTVQEEIHQNQYRILLDVIDLYDSIWFGSLSIKKITVSFQYF